MRWSRSGRANPERRGWRRRSPPTTRRSANIRASGFLSIGGRPRTTSTMRLRRSGNVRAERRGSRRRSRPIAPRSRSASASGFRSSGRRPKSISARPSRALGARENGTEHLEEAVDAYRAAAQEFTRERSPFQWALNVGGQGLAMMTIADRKNDAATAEQALAQINTAYDAMQSGRANTRISLRPSSARRARLSSV